MSNQEIKAIVELLRANPLGGTLDEMRAQFDGMSSAVASDVDVKERV